MTFPRVLITGATGFIGRHLCTALARQGWSVRAAVRQPGSAVGLPEAVEVVGPLSMNASMDVWQGPLAGMDVVVHLAARVHRMDDAAADPLSAYRAVNTQGTRRLAAAAARAGVRRFIFLSTVKVCGETAEAPLRETDAARPRDSYARSKWEAEQAIWRIVRDAEMSATVLRPPLVYGPGGKANFLRLMQIVDWGLPLPLAGIRNARSLIYVGNLVDAITACALSPAAAGQTFFVADAETPSTAELVIAIAAALNRPARLFAVPARWLMGLARMTPGNNRLRRLVGTLQVETNHIRHTLGWRPPFSMPQGIAETVAGYRRRKDPTP